MMHHLQLPEKAQILLSSLAQATGKREDEIISEAVLKYLEELEDIRDAEVVLKNPGKRWTLGEVEQGIDLDS